MRGVILLLLFFFFLHYNDWCGYFELDPTSYLFRTRSIYYYHTTRYAGVILPPLLNLLLCLISVFL